MTIKDAKRNVVTDAATRLFLSRSIAGVTIRDIAREAGVGEATVYRYFAGKTPLIVACALKLQEEVGRYFLPARAGENGYARLARFYGAYAELFVSRPELYRFLYEFDAYCVSEGVSGLDEYADNMDLFKEAYLSAYRDGLSDGSVAPLPDPALFYYATTHAVLSLAKKLAVEDRIVRQDAFTDRVDEIRTLSDAILLNLRPARL